MYDPKWQKSWKFKHFLHLLVKIKRIKDLLSGPYDSWWSVTIIIYTIIDQSRLVITYQSKLIYLKPNNWFNTQMHSFNHWKSDILVFCEDLIRAFLRKKKQKEDVENNPSPRFQGKNRNYRKGKNSRHIPF